MIPIALSILTSKIAGPIASLIAVLALLFGVTQCSEKKLAEGSVKRLANDIHAPVTGWEARLKTCQGSVATLDRAVADQNAAIAANAADGARRAKMLSDGLQQARKAAAAADKRSLDILAVKPRGADQCARLMDLDRQINGGSR